MSIPISTLPRGQRLNLPYVFKGFSLLLFALSLLAFQAGAASFTWDGGNADWTSTANWGGGPPGAGDTATINNGTVTVSTAVSVGTLNFSGATLTGNGTLTVSGTLTWGAIGTMSGTGTTTVLAGGTLSTSATATKLSQRTLSNAGTWTLTGSSSVVLDTGAILNNSGTMDCQGTAGIQFNSGGGTVTNSGTIKKTTGTGTASIANIGGTGTFTNTGTISAQSGTLQLGCGGSGTGGIYTTTGTATLNFLAGTQTLDSASSMTGAGTLGVTGGTVNMAGTITILGTLSVSGGTFSVTGTSNSAATCVVTSTGTIFTGSGTLNVSTLMTWSGGTLSGTGTTTVLAGGTLNMSAPASGSTILNQRTLTNAGTGTITGSNDIVIVTGAIFNNSGSLDCQGTAGIVYSGTAAAVNNSGTIKKTTGAGTASINDSNNSGSFTNTGTISAQSGTLQIECTGTGTGGIFTTTGTATLSFPAGTLTLDAASSMTGAGTMSLTGGTVNMAGTITIPGTLNVSGSTLSVTGTSNSAATCVVTGTGIVTGSGTLSVSSLMTWSGGTLSGTGTTTVLAGGTLTMSSTSTATTLSQRTLSNAGTGTMTGANNFSFDTGAIFNNSGSLDCQGTCGIQFNTGGGTINNSGTFKKTTATGTVSIDNNNGSGTFSNTGTLSTQLGTLTLACAFSQTAGSTTLAGGTLAGTTMSFQGGTLSGSGTLSASVVNTGATVMPGGASAGVLTVSGTYNQSAPGALAIQLGGINAGTQYAQLAIAGAATLGGALNASLINSFQPAGGNTFDVLTCSSRSGTFDTFNDNGIGLAASYASNKVTLTATLLPAISSANATTFTVGSAGTFAVTTTGSPAPSIARGGVALPSGITFVDNGDGTGTLAGTPAVNTNNTYALTFTPANSNGTGATQNFTLTVSPAAQVPAISSANAATFTVGSAGTFAVTTTGSPAPSIGRGGVTLPSGITFVDNGNGTGTLAGTPAVNTNNTYALTFTPANSNGTGATQNFTLTVSPAAPNLPPAITELVSSQSPAKTTTVLTFTLAASDVDSAALNYTLDFGDGSAPASGSFAPNTPTPIAYAYPAAGDFNVVATVTDGVSTVSQSIVQTAIAPASGGAGVPNISNGTDTVTNPDDGLSIGVASSDGGVIELSIDASGLVPKDTLVLTTAWGDIQGRTSVVTGPHPVHGYIRHGVFVATVTATSLATGALLGKGRKSLVVSASETGEKTTPPGARKPVPGTNSPLLGNAPNTVVNLSSMKGKFIFSGTANDTVSFAGTFALPLGFNPAEIHDYSMGLGNIVLNATVNGKGKGTSTTPTLKSLKLAYKLKKGQVAKGGELATVSATFTTAGMVNAGFDTEGITPKNIGTPQRGIQVAFQLDGAAYEALIPVLFAVSKNNEFGTITARHQ